MSKEVQFKNRDRLLHIGITIGTLRRVRGMSQEQLAEKAGISRVLLCKIEAPNIPKSFSIEVFLDIADALDVDPAELLRASVIPEKILEKSSKRDCAR